MKDDSYDLDEYQSHATKEFIILFASLVSMPILYVYEKCYGKK
jgi:hypothetical protein